MPHIYFVQYIHIAVIIIFRTFLAIAIEYMILRYGWVHGQTYDDSISIMPKEGNLKWVNCIIFFFWLCARLSLAFNTETRIYCLFFLYRSIARSLFFPLTLRVYGPLGLLGFPSPPSLSLPLSSFFLSLVLAVTLSCHDLFLSLFFTISPVRATLLPFFSSFLALKAKYIQFFAWDLPPGTNKHGPGIEKDASLNLAAWLSFYKPEC